MILQARAIDWPKIACLHWICQSRAYLILQAAKDQNLWADNYTLSSWRVLLTSVDFANCVHSFRSMLKTILFVFFNWVWISFIIIVILPNRLDGWCFMSCIHVHATLMRTRGGHSNKLKDDHLKLLSNTSSPAIAGIKTGSSEHYQLSYYPALMSNRYLV